MGEDDEVMFGDDDYPVYDNIVNRSGVSAVNDVNRSAVPAVDDDESGGWAEPALGRVGFDAWTAGSLDPSLVISPGHGGFVPNVNQQHQLMNQQHQLIIEEDDDEERWSQLR